MFYVLSFFITASHTYALLVLAIREALYKISSAWRLANPELYLRDYTPYYPVQGYVALIVSLREEHCAALKRQHFFKLPPPL